MRNGRKFKLPESSRQIYIEITVDILKRAKYRNIDYITDNDKYYIPRGLIHNNSIKNNYNSMADFSTVYSYSIKYAYYNYYTCIIRTARCRGLESPEARRRGFLFFVYTEDSEKK